MTDTPERFREVEPLRLGGRTLAEIRTWCTAIACARFEVERLTGELDEARKPPHCPTCGGGDNELAR